MRYTIFVLMFVTGCATMSITQQKRHDAMECMIQMKREEIREKTAFVACSRIYGLSTQEPKEDDGFDLGAPATTPSPSPSPSK